MSDTPNFASLLDEAPSEVNAPKPLPVGTYNAIIIPPVNYDKSSKKGTNFVEFTLKYTSAGPDVDEEDLAAMGGFEGKTSKVQFYLTPDAVYRLDTFHRYCGLDLSDKVSRRERNDQVVGSAIRVQISHESSKDGSTVYARIAKTLPVED